MEWKIFIKYKNKSYRILKVKQGASLDITIIPKSAICFSRKLIENSNIGDGIQIEYKKLGNDLVDHFSAHSITGQRHIKLGPTSWAHEPTIGYKFKNIDRAIPLLTMVASANKNSQEDTGSGKWFGFALPDDVNYIIMEIVAVPKNANIDFQQNFRIQNNIKTNETFDIKELDMQNCKILIITRTTNHKLADIPNNIVFQQVEGKTVGISRVEGKIVLAHVLELKIV